MPEPERNAADITIFGHRFTLRGTADPQSMRDLAAKVDGRMRELSKPKPGEPLHRIAILTALVLMDELDKARAALQSERGLLEEASRAAARLDLRLQAALRGQDRAAEATLGVIEEVPEVLDFVPGEGS